MCNNTFHILRRIGTGRPVIVTLLFCVLLLCCVSCRHTADDDSIPAIVQHRYWNYYERGLVYSLLGKWDKAADDFMVAMGLKEGALYPEYAEKRRTKTYGVRFLDNYFPHRELGICYYFLGRLDDAKNQLEISMSMLPSARAKFYMNRVRGAQFSKLQPGTFSPLSIEMEWPEGPLFTNRPYLKLNGVVASRFYVNEVRINGERELIELAQPEFVLNTELEFSTGRQPVRITATDLAGNSTQWERDVVVDLEGPEIAVSTSATQPTDAITVTFSDHYGIKTLTIDGKHVAPDENTTTHSLDLPLKPSRKITIEIEDKAGNKTILRQDTRDLRRASTESLNHYPDHRLAFTGFQKPASVTDPEAQSDVQLAVLPKSVVDEIAPIIRVNPDIAEHLYVTTGFYVLDLFLEDSGALDSFTVAINKRKMSKDLSQKKPIRYRISKTIELEGEVNNVLIMVQDLAGNVETKRFRLIRKFPHDKIEDFRMTLATHVAPIETQPESTSLRRLFTRRKDWNEITSITRILNDLLLQANHKRFNVLERDNEILSRLTFEHFVIHSSLKDYRIAIDRGALLPAEWYLRTTMSPWSGAKRNAWVLYGTLIDALDGSVIAVSDSYFEGDRPDDRRDALRILVDKILQQLPLLSTSVGSKKGNNGVIVPLGRHHNMKPNFRFMFISSQAVDVKFGDPMMSDGGQWIQGIVTDVNDNECLLQIYPKDAIDRIGRNDWVFMR